MSDQDSEEKNLAPSKEKLKKAREKGQIAKSQDVTSAMMIVFLTLYMILAWQTIMTDFVNLFDVSTRMAARETGTSWRGAMDDTMDSAMGIITPFYIISAFAIVIGSVISNKGMVFAFHPIKPDLKRVNPAEGFKKIFGLKNFIEFLKATVKCIVLVAALGFSAWYGLAAVLRIPYCSTNCAGEVLTLVSAPVIFIALGLFIVAALVDMNLQRWLFTREMKMTRTESKREMKEQHGDPLIQGELARIRRDSATGGSGNAAKVLKSRVPTLIICDGGDAAVALRYVQGETPAPVVVGKGRGERAAALIDMGIAARVYFENDAALTKELLRRGKLDNFVPEMFFKTVARILNRKH